MHKRADKQARRPSGGFTLVEVLLVVVIILIATGIAVPRFRGSFQHTQMQDAVRSTIRLSRYARSMAIVRQQPVEMAFSSTLLSLTLPAAGTNQPGRIDRRLPEDITIDRFETTGRQGLRQAGEEERHSVRFYPTGMNDGFELILRDARGRQVQIRCNPITGKTTAEALR